MGRGQGSPRQRSRRQESGQPPKPGLPESGTCRFSDAFISRTTKILIFSMPVGFGVALALGFTKETLNRPDWTNTLIVALFVGALALPLLIAAILAG